MEQMKVGYLAVVLLTALSAATLLAQKSEHIKLVNGIYSVLGESSTRAETVSLPKHSAVLIYDGRYVDSSQVASPQFVVLDTASFVPLILEGAPEAKKDGKGHSLLNVSLSKSYAGRLKEFSRAHLGGRIAIVIGNEVITMHNVRSVIEGGKFQITRCYDNACDVLLSKLSEER